MLDYCPINSYLQTKLQRRRKKRLVRLLWLILILGITTFVIFKFFSRQNIPSNQAFNQSLKNTVEKSLENTTGTYGIVIKNLKTGEVYNANEHQVFETGSLYKLWIMATVYKQIQNGQLIKDQILSEDIATLNDKFNIDPELAEQTEGTITLTVQEALIQMITISHNYAALLLTEKIKLSSVAVFLKDNNFNESSVGTKGDTPKSTSFDIALFFEKLYKQELVNKDYTGEMIDLLKTQQLNYGLPKYLPDKSRVASKTGEIGWFKHDAGIVFTDNGNYIIVVMSESDSPAGAQERIALLSKAVFDYFTKTF